MIASDAGYHIFNIERFATEDGPGIRTVVFLKGCILKCKWCANPESQSFQDEIMFVASNCRNCGKCIKICPKGAIYLDEKYGYITDSSRCDYCGRCVDNCFFDARSPIGKRYTARELYKELIKDEKYFLMSAGGITLSGGEPFLQSALIEEIAEMLKGTGITILVETCGHVSLNLIKRSIAYIDYIYFDIKHIDSKKHKELTGWGNELILQNLNWLTKNFRGKLLVRYPYIPGCNNDDESIKGLFEYIASLNKIKELAFLPYHRLGLPKYNGLGRDYEMDDMKSLKKSQIEYLLELGKTYGIKAIIQ